MNILRFCPLLKIARIWYIDSHLGARDILAVFYFLLLPFSLGYNGSFCRTACTWNYRRCPICNGEYLKTRGIKGGQCGAWLPRSILCSFSYNFFSVMPRALVPILLSLLRREREILSPRTCWYASFSISRCQNLAWNRSPLDHVDIGTGADPKKPSSPHLQCHYSQHQSTPWYWHFRRPDRYPNSKRRAWNELALFAAEGESIHLPQSGFQKILVQIVKLKSPSLFCPVLVSFSLSDNKHLSDTLGPIQRHPTSGNVKGYHVGESIFVLNSSLRSPYLYRDGAHDRFKKNTLGLTAQAMSDGIQTFDGLDDSLLPKNSKHRTETSSLACSSTSHDFRPFRAWQASLPLCGTKDAGTEQPNRTQGKGLLCSYCQWNNQKVQN